MLCVCVCVCGQVSEVDSVACGSFKTTDESQVKCINYAASSLEAALWAFFHTDNYKDGCLKVGMCVCRYNIHYHSLTPYGL